MKPLELKPLEFLGSSQKDLREMPANVRHALGIELLTVQYGGEPSDFKPMYVAKFANVVYVLHAFQKKTQKTTKYDIDLAAKRYKMIGAKS